MSNVSLPLSAWSNIEPGRLSVAASWRAALDCAAVLRDEIVCIDAGNIFDPYYLRDRFPDETRDGLLDRVHVARPFTIYQLRELVHRLPSSLQKHGSRVAIVPCVDSLFLDADIPPWERRPVFRQVIRSLGSTARALNAFVITSLVGRAYQKELSGGVASGPNFTDVH